MADDERIDDTFVAAGGGTVGAQLRAAREAQGLTVEHVAKHLKLAPRQVMALETDDMASLPSPTFVRGFVRNYARLLKIDPTSLLGVETSRRQAASPLEGITTGIGELRSDGHHSGHALRWLIPIGLVGLLVAGGVWYELNRSKQAAAVAESTNAAAVPVPAQAVTGASVTPVAKEASAPTGIGAPQAPSNNADVAPVTFPIVLPATPTPPQQTAEPAPASAQTQATQPGITVPAKSTATGSTLELSFGGSSWTEIRDSKGNVLTSRMQPAGSKLTVSGTPPFRMIVGNSSSVTLVRDGTTVDLSPYARGNSEVARFTLE